jgi:hypothetical protein
VPGETIAVTGEIIFSSLRSWAETFFCQPLSIDQTTEFDHVGDHQFDLPILLPGTLTRNPKVSPRQPLMRLNARDPFQISDQPLTSSAVVAG